MSSGLTDDNRIAMATAREFETAIAPAGLEAEPPREFEIRPRGWIKRVLPRTMFGRSLLIFIVPLVVLQAIATWVFYDRHWAAVSWRLAAGVAGDVALVIEALQGGRLGRPTPPDCSKSAGAVTDLDLKVSAGERLPARLPLGRYAAGRSADPGDAGACINLPFLIEKPRAIRTPSRSMCNFPEECSQSMSRVIGYIVRQHTFLLCGWSVRH